mmetsp:Transcript_38204/g.75758  ORF Transcript_38204/g.75758 Transcript_38204/m.75758 type:complete len:352 (-) Transcript_38204:19-1074(-)
MAPSRKPAAAQSSLRGNQRSRRQPNKLPRGSERALAWLDDVAKVRKWLARPAFDLPKSLKQGRGFAKLQDFLPPFVAEGARLALAAQPPEVWERAGENDREDSSYNDGVTHRFSISEVECSPVLLGIARVLSQMLPGMLPNFSAAAYSHQDRIAPHDDLVPESYTSEDIFRLAAAYGQGGLQVASDAWKAGPSCADEAEQRAEKALAKALASGNLQAIKHAAARVSQPPMGTALGNRAMMALPVRLQGNTQRSGGRPAKYTRVAAAVYYLSRGWKRSFGGELVDLETKQRHVPEFNTLVVFEVPRRHEVSAVKAPEGQRRCSIFGWWLLPDAEVKAASKGTRKRKAANFKD